MSQRPLLIFEASLTNLSSTGSCLLKMLQPLLGNCPIHVFASESELPQAPLLTYTKIPLPKRASFLRISLYSLLAACAFLFSRRNGGLRIASDGQFPFCHICYRHFNPHFFLSRRGDAIASTWSRRLARTLTYCCYALLERIALRHAVKIVVPSRGMAAELQLTYPALPADKIQIIPNPVDTRHFRRDSRFSSQSIYARLGIRDSAFVLCFCALASFTAKGLGIVLEALSQIGNPELHLIVIGGAPGEIREFQMMASCFHIAERVHFVGLQNDIRPYLWSSHVFVLPSAYESFSLVCFQAAAAGLPLIATRVYGVEDLLVDGVNGWMVERTDGAVAAAIQHAAASPERTSLMGRAAQERATAYDTQIFQSRWLQLLENEFGIRHAEEMKLASN